MKLAEIGITIEDIENCLFEGKRYIVMRKGIWEIRYSDAQGMYYATRIYHEVRDGVNLGKRGKFSIVDYTMVNCMLGREVLQG